MFKQNLSDVLIAPFSNNCGTFWEGFSLSAVGTIFMPTQSVPIAAKSGETDPGL